MESLEHTQPQINSPFPGSRPVGSWPTGGGDGRTVDGTHDAGPPDPQGRGGPSIGEQYALDVVGVQRLLFDAGKAVLPEADAARIAADTVGDVMNVGTADDAHQVSLHLAFVGIEPLQQQLVWRRAQANLREKVGPAASVVAPRLARALPLLLVAAMALYGPSPFGPFASPPINGCPEPPTMRGGPGGSAPPAVHSDLRDGWMAWIRVNNPFDWFCTFTFTRDVSPDEAVRRFLAWRSRLDAAVRAVAGPRARSTYVLATERTHRNRVHLHALLKAPGLSGLHRYRWESRWEGVGQQVEGLARIYPAVARAAPYLTKYVAKDGDLQVGGNFVGWAPRREAA